MNARFEADAAWAAAHAAVVQIVRIRSHKSREKHYARRHDQKQNGLGSVQVLTFLPEVPWIGCLSRLSYGAERAENTLCNVEREDCFAQSARPSTPGSTHSCRRVPVGLDLVRMMPKVRMAPKAVKVFLLGLPKC